MCHSCHLQGIMCCFASMLAQHTSFSILFSHFSHVNDILSSLGISGGLVIKYLPAIQRLWIRIPPMAEISFCHVLSCQIY